MEFFEHSSASRSGLPLTPWFVTAPLTAIDLALATRSHLGQFANLVDSLTPPLRPFDTHAASVFGRFGGSRRAD